MKRVARAIGRAVVACAAGAGLACAGSPPRATRDVGPPRVCAARVLAAAGPIIPQRGDTCRIQISRTDDRLYNCHIRIECGGDLVYGLADAGYVTCRKRGHQIVSARDRYGTAADGDPRLDLDLGAGRARVSDDSPFMELDLDLLTSAPAGYAEQACALGRSARPRQRPP